jgi:hypothetical protein
MSITSVYPTFNPYVGNPAADQLRRENQRREVIEPVGQMERSAAEKGVISEDKSRNGPQSTSVQWSDESKNRQTELKQAVEGRQQSGEQGNNNSSADGGGAGSQSKDQSQAGQQSSQQQAAQQAEQQKLAELKKRDAEVRAHEQAHAAVGGSLAGAPSYQYERGPDGQQYAVAGEVPIDVSPVAGDPRATIDKMQQVRAAALAPAEPSGADRRIAAEAQQTMTQAQAELVKQMSQARGNATGQATAEEASAATDPWFIADDNDSSNDPWALPALDMSPPPLNDNAQRSAVAGGLEPVVNQSAAGSADIAVSMVAGRVLESADLMQRRNSVISQFYRNAVEPTERPLRLTA